MLAIRHLELLSLSFWWNIGFVFNWSVHTFRIWLGCKFNERESIRRIEVMDKASDCNRNDADRKCIEWKDLIQSWVVKRGNDVSDILTCMHDSDWNNIPGRSSCEETSNTLFTEGTAVLTETSLSVKYLVGSGISRNCLLESKFEQDIYVQRYQHAEFELTFQHFGNFALVYCAHYPWILA